MGAAITTGSDTWGDDYDLSGSGDLAVRVGGDNNSVGGGRRGGRDGGGGRGG